MAGSATVATSSVFSDSGTIAAGKCCFEHSKSLAFRTFKLSIRKKRMSFSGVNK